MLSGNKGEWSEIYTLLKVISDKQLHAGDKNLEKIENIFYPIIKILRNESNGTYDYSYSSDLVVIRGSEVEFQIPIFKFQEKAAFLLSKLKEKTDRTFCIPEIENFIRSFHCTSLTASSTTKSDIRIVIHDSRTGSTPELGFSIKSQLGGASTLLNAGKTTNFVYKIRNTSLSKTQIDEINSITTSSKIRDRIEKIKKHSGYLEFVKTERSVFGNNLTLIDSSLTKIISEIILLYYTSSQSKIRDLLNDITLKNPLGYNYETEHPFYEYKLKRFLTDTALGMMPSEVWTGALDATGGSLIVRSDGEIICYHIYNRNEFEDYLLNNTKLETASSSRHNFGTIYEENGSQYIKLNLQIRFIK